jgi:transposase
MDVKERYTQIVELHETRRLSNSQVARELGISEQTVRRYLAKWRSGIPVENVRCIGRPRKVDKEERQFITQHLAQNSMASSRSLAWELAAKGVEVTRRCVSQNLADLGYRYSAPRVVPLLTDRHKALRVEWCHKFLEFDWERVYFSDETYVELQGKPNCVWHKKGRIYFIMRVGNCRGVYANASQPV